MSAAAEAEAAAAGAGTCPEGDASCAAPEAEAAAEAVEESGGMLTVVIALGIIAALLLWLAWPMIKRWREASAAAGIDVLSTNPFARFRLPPQRAAFFEAVKKYPPGAQEITVALVHRAMATYPMAKGLADEREGIISTYHHGMCSDELYNNFKRTEDMINREVQEVQFAADEINPGWGRSIWAEVAQHHRQIMARRQAEMMQANKRAEIERQVKLARNKQKNTQANSAQEAAKAERDAERAAAQLLKEEEASSKKATPTATKSGGKKKKKR